MQTIRLWRLGDLEHKIIPSKEAIDKFRQLLSDIKDENVVDIVWGPDIQCQVIVIDGPVTDHVVINKEVQP